MKSTLFLVILTIAIGINAGQLYSQENKTCGATEYLNQMIEQDPSIPAKMKQYENEQAIYIEQQKAKKTAIAQTYVIPVVFHVIHNNGYENISNAQIESAIAILNRDFAKMNADTISVKAPFNDIIAKCNYEFRLAKKDPNGNCTNGIERIRSFTYAMGGNAAKISQWPREKYLNIWVVGKIDPLVRGSGQVAAYATFPSAAAGFLYPLDGVLSLHDYVGNIGTSNNNNSRTLTHEVGHYLNLSHTWGNDSDVAIACGDDGVTDTPITEGNSNCNTPIDYTCTSQSVIETYKFDSVKVSSGIIDPTPAPKLTDSLILFGNFNAVNAANNPSKDSVFSYSGWGIGGIDQDTAYSSLTGNIDLSKYYEVTLTPNYGRVMSVSALSFSVSRSATGVKTFAVRSSKDNFSSNLTAISTDPLVKVKTDNIFYYKMDTTRIVNGCKVSIAPSITSVPLTFRIYGWNAEDVAGSFDLDNFTVSFTGGINENVENYMNYSYCTKMFTLGQQARMDAALNSSVSSRNNLWSTANLAATGVNGTTTQDCPPIAGFYNSFGTQVCEGSGNTVSYFDNSTNGTPTSWSWTFSNGTPAASTAQNPTVTFNTPGWQSVSLTVSNANGSSTKTIDKQIYVSPTTASYVGNFYDSFEDKSKFDSEWFITNFPVEQNNPTIWQHTTSAAYTGVSSAKLNSYVPYNAAYPFSDNIGDVDELITPSMDLAGVSPLYLGFRYSVATRAFKSKDVAEKLQVYFSTSCGKAWALLTTISGATLTNAGSTTSSYIPPANNTSLWKTFNLPLTSTQAKSNIRFKFVYSSSGYSNNVYIDDINIGSSPLGINELEETANTLAVYPNPANETARITYHVGKKQYVDLAIYDVLGNKVLPLVAQTQDEGDYSYALDKNTIAKGMYFIRLNVNDKSSTTRKFIMLD